MFEFLSFELIVHDSAGGWFQGFRVIGDVRALCAVHALCENAPKPIIQPLGVGYANRPKKAKIGGVCGVFPDIRLPGFNLTTSAR